MSLLHDAYTALLSGLTYKENGKIRWANENNRDIWITIIDVNKEKYYVEYINNGDKYWYQNGLRHRVDGPSTECSNGYKEWCQNGKLHRLDGPALELANGSKGWYVNGNCLFEEEFNKVKNESIT